MSFAIYENVQAKNCFDQFETKFLQVKRAELEPWEASRELKRAAGELKTRIRFSRITFSTAG